MAVVLGDPTKGSVNTEQLLLHLTFTEITLRQADPMLGLTKTDESTFRLTEHNTAHTNYTHSVAQLTHVKKRHRCLWQCVLGYWSIPAHMPHTDRTTRKETNRWTELQPKSPGFFQKYSLSQKF